MMKWMSAPKVMQCSNSWDEITHKTTNVSRMLVGERNTKVTRATQHLETIDSKNFFANPSGRCWDIWMVNGKIWPVGGVTWKSGEHQRHDSSSGDRAKYISNYKKLSARCWDISVWTKVAGQPSVIPQQISNKYNLADTLLFSATQVSFQYCFGKNNRHTVTHTNILSSQAQEHYLGWKQTGL